MSTQAESIYMPSTLQPHGYARVPALQTAAISQSHHESLMSTSSGSEPLSAYALWKIEEDERFYSTFPQARNAAQQYNPVYDAYYDGYNYTMGDSTGMYSTESTIQNNFVSSATCCVPSTDLPRTNSDGGLHLNYEAHATPYTTVLPIRDCLTRRGSHAQRYDSLDTQLFYTYPPPTEVVQSHFIIPSQQSRPIPQQLIIPTANSEPYMDHLPSPPSASSPNIPTTPQDLFNTQDSKAAINTEQGSGAEQPSSHWSTYGSQASHYSHEPACDIEVKSESTLPPSPRGLHGPHHRPLHTNSVLPANKQPSRHTSWPLVRTPSPRGIRLTPLPTSKRVLPRKPPLACLFCRGRKIACGAPDPASTDRTCNQCQRRSIKCEYPLESRRGMRKKKNPVTNLSTIGPRVKLGRRSKSAQ